MYKNYLRMMLTLVIIIGTACLVCSCGGNAEKETEASEQNDSYYDFEFHRGARDARPENTLYAFQYSIEHGATTIECDMLMTKDEEIVLAHNKVLNPDITVDENGKRIEPDTYHVNKMRLKELKKFNVGCMDESTEYYDLHGRTQVQIKAEIPTLRESFELIRDSGNKDIRMSIEIKSNPDPAMHTPDTEITDYDLMLHKFDDMIKEFGFQDRVLLQSFDWALLTKMKEIDPDIATVALYSEQPSWGTPDSTTLWLDRDEPSPWLGGLNIHDFDDDPVKAAHELDIDCVSPYYEEITEEQVKEAHEFGMTVVPWTINSEEDMQRMLDIGVDGMITDKPWIMRPVLEKAGKKLVPEMKYDSPYHIDQDHIEVEGKKAEGGNDAAV